MSQQLYILKSYMCCLANYLKLTTPQGFQCGCMNVARNLRNRSYNLLEHHGSQKSQSYLL